MFSTHPSKINCRIDDESKAPEEMDLSCELINYIIY